MKIIGRRNRVIADTTSSDSVADSSPELKRNKKQADKAAKKDSAQIQDIKKLLQAASKQFELQWKQLDLKKIKGLEGLEIQQKQKLHDWFRRARMSYMHSKQQQVVASGAVPKDIKRFVKSETVEEREVEEIEQLIDENTAVAHFEHMLVMEFINYQGLDVGLAQILATILGDNISAEIYQQLYEHKTRQYLLYA